MAVEARRDPRGMGRSSGSLTSLGCTLGALRRWVWRAEIDDGVRLGSATDCARRIAELERENRELRDEAQPFRGHADRDRPASHLTTSTAQFWTATTKRQLHDDAASPSRNMELS